MFGLFCVWNFGVRHGRIDAPVGRHAMPLSMAMGYLSNQWRFSRLLLLLLQKTLIKSVSVYGKWTEITRYF